MLHDPQAEAAASPELFNQAVAHLQNLNAQVSRLIHEAPALTEAEAQDLFYHLFDRVIYSDTFGSNLYWVTKVRADAVDLKALDENIELLVIALKDRLVALHTEGEDVFKELTTDFAIREFSHAHLADRITAIENLVLLAKQRRALSEKERFFSPAFRWDAERKAKKLKIASLKTLWHEESLTPLVPPSPTTSQPPPKASPSSTNGTSKVELPKASLLELEGITESDVKTDDSRRGPINSGNVSRDGRKLPEHMQKAEDRKAAKNADQLNRMNAMRANQGFKPITKVFEIKPKPKY